jgi:hypothetical protein
MGEVGGILLRGGENDPDILEGFQASPACPSGKSNVKMKTVEWSDVIV